MFSRLLVRYFLPRLLKRTCGDQPVPRSGEDGARVNCFYVQIPKGDNPDYGLLSIAGFTVQALQFDGTSCSIPASLDLSGISAESVEVTHFYGLDEVRFQGLAALAVGRTFGLPYARIHLARIANAIAQSFSIGDRSPRDDASTCSETRLRWCRRARPRRSARST